MNGTSDGPIGVGHTGRHRDASTYRLDQRSPSPDDGRCEDAARTRLHATVIEIDVVDGAGRIVV